MTDFAISPITNDFQIPSNRFLTVTGNAAKAQRIRSRLYTVKGEWFLDTDFGLDYRGVVWNKLTPRSVLSAHVQREILKSADEGDRITEFTLDYVGTTRTLTITAQITSLDGTVTNVSV